MIPSLPLGVLTLGVIPRTPRNILRWRLSNVAEDNRHDPPGIRATRSRFAVSRAARKAEHQRHTVNRCAVGSADYFPGVDAAEAGAVYDRGSFKARFGSSGESQ